MLKAYLLSFESSREGGAATRPSRSDRATANAQSMTVEQPQAPLTRREIRERAAAEAARLAQASASTEAPNAASVTSEPDAFEAASKLFGTGPQNIVTPTVAEAEVPEAPVDATAEEIKPEYLGSTPRRSRSNFQRITTSGLSIAVMAAVGVLAVSVTLPALSPDVTPANAATSISTTQKAEPIEAFVASTSVQNADVPRAANYATATLADIAASLNIAHTSSDVFTNNRAADIQWPFAVGVPMSYGYGMRDGALHQGIDFTPGEGAEIQAIAAGTVRVASTTDSGGYGVNVYVDHVIDGEVVSSHYAHMLVGSLQVVDGQQVKVGDIIGLVGDTGRSFGAHLHFEILINNVQIDPMPWMKEHAG